MSCIIHGANARPLGRLERVSGIEPPSSAWKADIMLLYANWSADVPVFGRFVLPVATKSKWVSDEWLPRDYSHD
jgi:hypothetical protein